MAVLTAGDRLALLKEFASEISAQRVEFGLTRAETIAAVEAIDDWIDANTAAFNTAIPQPARGVLTASQKARIFLFIVRRRFEVT